MKPVSNKPMQPEVALKRLSDTCARREICEQDALKKLYQWQVPEEEQAKIMAQLVQYGFIDNERYAKAYAEDKMKYNRWGARKVEMMLRSKGIDDDIISAAIEEASDDDDQAETLKKLLEEKSRSLRNETDPYKKKQKLLRFAISRGFDYGDVMDILDD